MQSSLNQENQLILMKQTSENKSFNSIKRIDDKESSWIAWESLKNSQIKNSSLINNILFWRLNTWSYVFINTVEHCHSFNLFFKQISSCLVIRLLKSVLKNFEIVSLKSLMLIHRNHQVLRHFFMKMMNHLLKW